MHRVLSLSTLILLALATPAWAGPKAAKTRALPLELRIALAEKAVKSDEAKQIAVARSSLREQLSGSELEASAAKLSTELRWHRELPAALAAAAAEGRPLLWIQALGELDGHL